jgi:hypothetical protein
MNYPAQEQIRWKDVVSSNVRKVGWDKDSNMYVLFRTTNLNDGNTLYMYRGVPRQRVIAAARANSVGQYLNRKIKPFFEAVKIR